MSWKKVPRGAPVKSHLPSIGIGKRGRIAWNEALQQALDNPEFVELLYDEASRRLGLRKTKVATLDVYAVHKSPRQNSWEIYAKAALKALGIRVTRAFRRLATIEDGVAAVDVAELVSESSEF